MAGLELRSPKFSHGESIPTRYGYTEDNVNPQLEISGVPSKTESLALVMDDPDAVEPAGKVWDHWVVWNIEPNTSQIGEDETPPGAVEGKNDYGEWGYGGPNPPDKEHTYKFKLYALNTVIDLRRNAKKEDLEEAMEGHIIEKAVLEGTYAP
ncbi:MAG: YbhB/YbcL family Raf kinase inhibitor-like protein [Candidatus Natronoplasma sp.]